MAIDLSTDKAIFEALKEHVGHEIECVVYGPAGEPVGVALECVNCGTVLISAESDILRGMHAIHIDTQHCL